MPDPSVYFWTPRGDAQVIRNEGRTVVLSIDLASYGPGAPSWDVDRFNTLKFFCLQLIVGFWRRAKYVVAIGAADSPELTAIVASHPHKAALDELQALSAPARDPADETQWSTFGAAAERIVTDVSIERQGALYRTLTFTVADPAWIAHLGPLPTWCLG